MTYTFATVCNEIKFIHSVGKFWLHVCTYRVIQSRIILALENYFIIITYTYIYIHGTTFFVLICCQFVVCLKSIFITFNLVLNLGVEPFNKVIFTVYIFFVITNAEFFYIIISSFCSFIYLTSHQVIYI